MAAVHTTVKITLWFRTIQLHHRVPYSLKSDIIKINTLLCVHKLNQLRSLTNHVADWRLPLRIKLSAKSLRKTTVPRTVKGCHDGDPAFRRRLLTVRAWGRPGSCSMGGGWSIWAWKCGELTGTNCYRERLGLHFPARPASCRPRPWTGVAARITHCVDNSRLSNM
jgi:hypothetical protein